MGTDFNSLQIIATPSGQSASPQGFGKPSPSKLQHAIIDRIKSLPEQYQSELIRIVEEECHNPANHDISEDAPISAVPQENTSTGQAVPSQTQEKAIRDVSDEIGYLSPKGKGRQVDTSTSQPSGFPSAALDEHPVPDLRDAPSEPYSSDSSVEGCHCSGQCQCHFGKISSSPMQDLKFALWYKDNMADEADEGCWPSDTSHYT